MNDKVKDILQQLSCPECIAFYGDEEYEDNINKAKSALIEWVREDILCGNETLKSGIRKIRRLISKGG